MNPMMMNPMVAALLGKQQQRPGIPQMSSPGPGGLGLGAGGPARGPMMNGVDPGSPMPGAGAGAPPPTPMPPGMSFFGQLPDSMKKFIMNNGGVWNTGQHTGAPGAYMPNPMGAIDS